jgi:ribose/xylose/arabinose/galactoside ABC-type transport system permease subunit
MYGINYFAVRYLGLSQFVMTLGIIGIVKWPITYVLFAFQNMEIALEKLFDTNRARKKLHAKPVLVSEFH